MANKNYISVEQAKEIVIRYAIKPIQRKDLVDKCVHSQDLTIDQLKDRTPGAPLHIIKCRFGNAIEQLIRSNILEITDDNALVCKDLQVAVTKVKRDTIIENAILEQLENATITKKLLFEKLVKLAKKLNVKEEVIAADAGRLLKNLVESQKIILKNDNYSLFTLEESIDEKNRRLFTNISDEALVDNSVAMLTKWLKKCGYSGIHGENTDGPQDGGIDGRITATDKLNYHETIIIQVKNRHNSAKQAPLKEVREFCGVLSAEANATKGLFITNVKYNQETIKFAKKYKTKYLVLIDGEHWLQLANECGYELQETE